MLVKAPFPLYTEQKFFRMHDSSPDIWQQPEEGKLAVDIYRDDQTLVVRSLVAGVSDESLEIAVNGDLLTIRGTRIAPHTPHSDHVFLQECYWGPFSRSIVLPLDVDSSHVDATISQGILEIRLPLRHEGKPIAIRPRLIE